MAQKITNQQVYDIPYAPTADDRLSTMMDFAKVHPGESAIDLGAGTGKIVLALARAGAQTVGVEIDRERAKEAQMAIAEAGLGERAAIIRGSFWEHNLSGYDIITVYGITKIMERLEEKILNEAKPAARIISNFFEFPNWKPVHQKDEVYLYVQGS
jgi:precorrin-6B methylase 2